MIRLTCQLITERRRRYCGLDLVHVHTGLVDNANFVLVIDELHEFEKLLQGTRTYKGLTTSIHKRPWLSMAGYPGVCSRSTLICIISP